MVSLCKIASVELVTRVTNQGQPNERKYENYVFTFVTGEKCNIRGSKILLASSPKSEFESVFKNFDFNYSGNVTVVHEPQYYQNVRLRYDKLNAIIVSN